MLKFDRGNLRFNMRSTAVVIQDQHILIHKTPADSHWSLPGGRVEFMETSDHTLVREMQEELGWQCRVERMLWYVENFFSYDEISVHEITQYYLMSANAANSVKSETDFRGVEPGLKQIFRWVPLSRIDGYGLKPDFLRERLTNLPETIERIVVIDVPTERVQTL